MRLYLNETVMEAAKNRLRWLFAEFPNVVVNTSGGKDSTVLLHLTLEVAEELDRLPLRVMFLDQEAEWESVISHMRGVMADPRVDPEWLQIPFRLFNAASSSEHWLRCWDPDEQDVWMRPQELNSVKHLDLGTDRFQKQFAAWCAHEYPDEKAVLLTGMRAEESGVRNTGFTKHRAYKWATWGRAMDKALGHYTMHPLYDWRYADVWGTIARNGWPYPTLYDDFYRLGVGHHKMRVSSLLHETAIHALFMVQELEPHTYEALCRRVPGVDAAGKLGHEEFFPGQLPTAFVSWGEYRDYLLEHLIDDENWRREMAKRFASHERRYKSPPLPTPDEMHKVHARSILTHDWEGIRIANFDGAHRNILIKKRRRGEFVF